MALRQNTVVTVKFFLETLQATVAGVAEHGGCGMGMAHGTEEARDGADTEGPAAALGISTTSKEDL